MPNKILGSILIILNFAIVGLGMSDPAVIPPHPVPLFDKMEIVLGISMIIFSFWAGIKLIRQEGNRPGPPKIDQ